MGVGTAPLMGTGPEDGGKAWYFTWYQQWSSLFSRGCNWYDFTLLKVQGEYAPYSGRWELELGLLGVNLVITWVYDDRFNREIVALAESIEAERTAVGASDV